MWRDKPSVHYFSCYSAPYRGLSRIDGFGQQFGTSQGWLGDVRSSEHLWSFPYQCQNYYTSPSHKYRLCQVYPFWFMLFPDSNPIPKAIVEFLEYNQGMARSTVVWDALKAHLWGLLHRSPLLKPKSGRISCSVRLPGQKSHILLPQPQSLSVDGWKLRPVSTGFHYCSWKHTLNEEENTEHLLAMIAKAQYGTTHIEAIQNDEEETVSG